MKIPAGHPDTGKPFAAEFEEVRLTKAPDGTRRESRFHWKLYRDSAGRSRSEIAPEQPGGEGTVVAMIVDPAAGEIAVLDAVSGQRIDESAAATPPAGVALPVPGAGSANWPPWPHQGTPQTEDLGTRLIEGLQCTGRRISFRDGTTETWESPELHPQAVWTRSVSATDEYEARMFNIRLGEPDPLLFRIPKE